MHGWRCSDRRAKKQGKTYDRSNGGRPDIVKKEEIGQIRRISAETAGDATVCEWGR